MTKDAFSKCHPAVNLLFFLGVIGAAVLIQHPAYVAAGVLAGGCYYLLLTGKKGLKTFLWLVPLFVFVTAINPIFNTRGSTVLFFLGRRPYTWEALQYGAALGGVFVALLLWFGCYNRVLTGDKLTSLFGNLAISLLLVMVLRMVPNLIRKTRQIIAARRSLGKGQDGKLKEGTTVLGAMTTWALEGSIVTGDSMRARGYGSGKRTGFMLYRMGFWDWLLAVVVPILLILLIIAAISGQMQAEFAMDVQIAPVSWGLAVYTLFLWIPTILYGKEAVQWHISRSRI